MHRDTLETPQGPENGSSGQQNPEIFKKSPRKASVAYEGRGNPAPIKYELVLLIKAATGDFQI